LLKKELLAEKRWALRVEGRMREGKGRVGRTVSVLRFIRFLED